MVQEVNKRGEVIRRDFLHLPYSRGSPLWLLEFRIYDCFHKIKLTWGSRYLVNVRRDCVADENFHMRFKLRTHYTMSFPSPIPYIRYI
jgi:hypothetical protein